MKLSPGRPKQDRFEFEARRRPSRPSTKTSRRARVTPADNGRHRMFVGHMC